MNWLKEIDKILEGRLNSTYRALESAERAKANLDEKHKKDLMILQARKTLLEKVSVALQALRGKELPEQLLTIQTVEDQDCQKILEILQAN